MLRATMLAAALLAFGPWTADASAGSLAGTLTVAGQDIREGQIDQDHPEVRFSVSLIGGRDYAVRGKVGSEMCAAVLLFDPGHHRVAGDPSGTSCGGELGGFEYRAAMTGTYVVAIRGLGPQGFPTFYRVGVAPDCRGDATTGCRVKLGADRQALVAFYGDRDAYKITMDPSHTYSFTVDGPLPYDILLLGPDGKLLAAGQADGGPILQFRPGRRGDYIVAVSGNDEAENGDVPYVLSVR